MTLEMYARTVHILNIVLDYSNKFCDCTHPLLCLRGAFADSRCAVMNTEQLIRPISTMGDFFLAQLIILASQ